MSTHNELDPKFIEAAEKLGVDPHELAERLRQGEDDIANGRTVTLAEALKQIGETQ